MTNFSIDIQGYNRVENKLRALASGMPKITSAVVYKWAQGTRAILKSTPYPQPPRKSYRRTGRLANSWRAVRTTTGAQITNTAAFKGRSYSRYVVGDGRGEGQAWMHKGRWWKARPDVIDKETKKLTEMLSAEIVKEWRK